MWWDVLPPSLIVGACFGGIGVFNYFCNRIFTGNPYLRDVKTKEQLHHYIRDLRLSGGVGAHKQVGLENIK